MAVSVATIPPYAFPGASKLTVVASASGNWVRLWLTDAPPKSKLRKKLTEAAGGSNASRVEIWAGPPGIAVAELEFDVGGVYAFKAQEYTRGASVTGGAYAGDPGGFQSEHTIGSEDTVVVYIGQRSRFPFGTQRDRAWLTVWTWNDRIRKTNIIEHGVVTPSFETSSPVAATVVAYLNIQDDAPYGTRIIDGLASAALSTVVGDIFAQLADLRTKFDAHRTQPGRHHADDSVNVVGVHWDVEDGIAGFIACVNKLRQAFIWHITSSASGGEVGGGGYHSTSDWARHPVADPASDLPTAIVLMADLRRAYALHIGFSGHLAADTTNVLAAGSPLIELQGLFLGGLATTEPQPSSTDNSGFSFLLHMVGAQDTTP